MQTLAEPPATAKPKAGLKKINLGGISAAKADKKTEYPVLPDPEGDISLLVRDIVAEVEQLDALEGSLAVKKAELSSRAMGYYFEHLHGRHDIPSSVEAKNCNSSVLVSFQNRYKDVSDEGPIMDLLGEERTAQFFRQSFALKIDGDAIPEAVSEELIGELQELFAKHGATAALSAKSVIKPTKDFHTARHSALSVAENLELQKIAPIVAMVKTKGGRK